MALANLTKELQNFDWNNLSDIESIGVWPGVVKFVIAMFIFVLCLGLGFWFDIRNLQGALERWTAEESTLRNEFELKAVMAANLEEYKAQTVEMEEAFSELLRQLPSQTEVPDLVDDITETGLGSNLAFSRIELDAELAQEFYIEQPIQVEVMGNYHDFGTFVSGVASLPRIVTLHDFEITAMNQRAALSMTITAKTYRYRTEDEQNAFASTP
ncbi:MAG: type 4a pilus biogenesis protein PilO [Gammaproteobacteria bacterium]|nr:type 4a pilus biogenesis protein PilO [Gammaproteobacteria bacterium]MDP2139888.1 type 4a pilus biogenesis protein PilO [Gammaproteobacteria bacterium]MDP2347708.1 type 4a pilus biogenesis protein PilO [Gammaproteobacteria bacterium]